MPAIILRIHQVTLSLAVVFAAISPYFPLHHEVEPFESPGRHSNPRFNPPTGRACRSCDAVPHDATTVIALLLTHCTVCCPASGSVRPTQAPLTAILPVARRGGTQNSQPEGLRAFLGLLRAISGEFCGAPGPLPPHTDRRVDPVSPGAQAVILSRAGDRGWL